MGEDQGDRWLTRFGKWLARNLGCFTNLGLFETANKDLLNFFSERKAKFLTNTHSTSAL